MLTEDDLLRSYFTEQDITGLTPEEFQIAVAGLIEKGLMEVVERGGQKFYRPTLLAQKIKTHLNSNPKNQS
jgi:hypothetical protein